jgi:hypothetical protein
MRTKGTKDKSIQLRIQLQPKCHNWLQMLVDKGRFGNSKPAVAVVLLGHQFKALMDQNELPSDLTQLSEIAPFPGDKAPNPESKETSGG